MIFLTTYIKVIIIKLNQELIMLIDSDYFLIFSDSVRNSVRNGQKIKILNYFKKQTVRNVGFINQKKSENFLTAQSAVCSSFPAGYSTRLEKSANF